jgi:hypothetical protein
MFDVIATADFVARGDVVLAGTRFSHSNIAALFAKWRKIWI